MEKATPLADPSQLAEVFRRYPQIRAAYLFGLAAKGRLHAEGDLDLAVLPWRGVPQPNLLDPLADLACCGFCRVDLIFLDTEGIVLKFKAVRRNRLLCAAEGFSRGAFFSRVVRQHLDFAPRLRVHRDAHRRRVFRGPGRDPATLPS
ncbi:MAG: hypothetical protein J7452_10750 [Thermoflexus sp.]|jgi:predicted nucleotidyltransferase|nr:hypothetical protein [Thermoflexus sp.]